MADRDLYRILDVDRDADADAIKTSYRSLTRRFHPDVNPGDEAAERRFKEIAAAYHVLSDPEKRKQYDEMGDDAEKVGFDPEKAAAWRQWKAQSEKASDFHVPGGVDFDLGDLFGDAFRRQPEPRRGRDIESTMELSLEDVATGATREIALDRDEPCAGCAGSGRAAAATRTSCSACAGRGRVDVSQGPLHFQAPCASCGGSGDGPGPPCPSCAGRGQTVRRARLTVKIPKGIGEDQKIRLAGQGEPGAPAGDLLVQVRLARHRLFRRDDRDLHLDLPITVAEAISGATVDVPTLGNDVQLKVPPGSQGGRKLRLRNKGLPARSGQPGHLFVTLHIVLPESEDPRLAELAAELSELYDGDVRAALKGGT